MTKHKYICIYLSIFFSSICEVSPAMAGQYLSFLKEGLQERRIEVIAEYVKIITRIADEELRNSHIENIAEDIEINGLPFQEFIARREANVSSNPNKDIEDQVIQKIREHLNINSFDRV